MEQTLAVTKRRVSRFQRSAPALLYWRLIFGVIVWVAVTVATASAQELRNDRRSLSLLFGGGTAPNPLEVYRRSRQMPEMERYEYLLNCVLPESSNQIRLAVDYLPTSPSPPIWEKYGILEPPLIHSPSENRRPSGGVLISPAVELVKVAQQSGKLKELQKAL
ncbi:MAG: hypothetical protein KDA84_24455, partial [Planctomycetaceae bacterium]|nr:hypothetical protein [Planctomycetaceae bacterium]